MDVNSIGQMHVRLTAYLPRDLAQAVHPKAVNDALIVAWQHGWRDPEWIANYALEGTNHESVRDAASVFIARLREIAAEDCPRIETPTPPRELPRAPGWNPPATAEQRAHWAQIARDGLAAARRGDVEAPWTEPIGDADVDPWEVGT